MLPPRLPRWPGTTLLVSNGAAYCMCGRLPVIAVAPVAVSAGQQFNFSQRFLNIRGAALTARPWLWTCRAPGAWPGRGPNFLEDKMAYRSVRSLAVTGITIASAMVLIALGATGASAAATATGNPAHATVAATTVGNSHIGHAGPLALAAIQLGNTGGEPSLGHTAAAAEGSYPPVCNCFAIWLTGSPDQYMTPACKAGTIYLTKGEYEWDTILFSDTNGPDLDTFHYIYLDSSNYSWGDCLIPENGYYIQSSELCPLNLPSRYPCVNITEYQYYVSSGTWSVGSWLDWQHL